ncbi:kinase-like domain-containing protein [Rhizophagus irregularis DAOM 181602=DAOM 197198]|nr:kinase-like domain-containing protein [Rhizophagus irregularis DAOM 181602=DAOM 197198]
MQRMKYENFPVILKCLLDSQDITSDFLREIKSYNMFSSQNIVWCYGITKDPESGNFMIVMGCAKDEPKNAIDNKDDDNSFEEYSESIEAIDFTKLDLDKSS